MKSELFAFEKLKAYKYSRALVRSVYKLLRKLPYEEKDALRDQLQRAVISVPSNIAEGMGRKTIKAKQQFIEYSYSSLMEVLCQLQLANDLGYISEEELNDERVHIEDTARIISGLYSYLETKEKTQKRSEDKVWRRLYRFTLHTLRFTLIKRWKT